MTTTREFPGDTAAARELRQEMVQHQLVGRGLRDARVLDAFRQVPRHLFCPRDTALQTAYADHPLSIGHNQTISQPAMVAEMTAHLDLAPDATVLEIGTGSGYQAAILALLAGTVHTVERIPALADAAQDRFAALALANVQVHVGDGTLGWPDAAPYDAIIVTAAAPSIPDRLKEQLADGGVLAIPVGPRYVQDLVICRRHGERITEQRTTGCRFVPLIGADGWPD